MASKGTILVTGTNGGLGSAIVQNILSTPNLASNYTGLYAVRKAATATKLQAALARAPSSHKHETLDVDLGSLAGVREACGRRLRTSTPGWPGGVCPESGR
ncbi:hypothetical protein V8C37DRAFT_214401 [Trichoderma ceciliae]